MPVKQFEVYVNLPNRRSVGHVVGCPHAKIHGGSETAAGGHMEPFDSADAAELAGWMRGQPFHWCEHCEKTLQPRN